MSITFRSSGYALFALLSGAVATGYLIIEPALAFRLLALWVMTDLAVGGLFHALHRGASIWPWAHSAMPDDQRVSHALLSAALCVILAAGLAQLFPLLVRWVILGCITGGIMAAAISARRPDHDMLPALAGIQVTTAWAVGHLAFADWSIPLLGLGAVAGLGTFARLRHIIAPTSISQWIVRMSWLALAGALLWLQQPLLGGLVALTALADDLHRQKPRRPNSPDPLLALSWLGTWLIVAVAITRGSAGL